MNIRDLYEREKNAVVYGQSARVRLIKYSILFPLFAFLWWTQGLYVSLQVVGALFILALIAHFFYRYKTNGWTKESGGFKMRA